MILKIEDIPDQGQGKAWILFDGIKSVRYEHRSIEILPNHKPGKEEGCLYLSDVRGPTFTSIVADFINGEEEKMLVTGEVYLLNDKGETVERIR
jgi:hypothetical protein